MRWGIVLCLLVAKASASPLALECSDANTAELTIDGLLDDWHSQVLARVGTAPDDGVAFRCAWDGSVLALAIDIADDRVVRVRGGKGHEDRVAISLRAGGAPLTATIYPGTPIAASKIAAPAKVEAADSLQPHGFSIELRVPASRIAGFSPSTPTLALSIVFHDSDQATGGKDTDVALDATLELADRSKLFAEFLRATDLTPSDITVDRMAELDPDHPGNERLVAGGTVIGVLGAQFAYVTLPVSRASDVKSIELLPLGRRGEQIIAAVVREAGNRATRDVLVMWAAWGGRIQLLAQIEVREEEGGNLLESRWTVKAGELLVTPKPPIGWTEASWTEQFMNDVDPIALPWDRVKGGSAYKLVGQALRRRVLPPAKPR